MNCLVLLVTLLTQQVILSKSVRSAPEDSECIEGKATEDNTMDEMIEQVHVLTKVYCVITKVHQVTPNHVSLDDLEDLINSLSAEEMEELAECDPDVSKMDQTQPILL